MIFTMLPSYIFFFLVMRFFLYILIALWFDNFILYFTRLNSLQEIGIPLPEHLRPNSNCLCTLRLVLCGWLGDEGCYCNVNCFLDKVFSFDIFFMI
ncbi:hypothetical protein HanPI659440_Chr14g0560231 [Helianthus annuus]|nr:hypothetical protein HanPI659440_Chr14g0560231 [Helianthus annuus]